jgi:6-phospho-beta-glucosidase
MARLKIAYIGGGSTRAPGTMASIIDQAQNFDGSEVVLIDLFPERLEVVKTLAEKMARHRNMDLKITTTLDRRVGLEDCDAVLTSYRPGGFEARYIDESIPLRNGIIGQETQGPGGFFMALRSIHIMQGIIDDIRAVAPQAIVFNYTNPINIVSQAVTSHVPDVPIYSFCEGPYFFTLGIAEAADLDIDKFDTVMVGLNHACWSVRHLYDGEDVMPLLAEAYERKIRSGVAHPDELGMRILKLAIEMDSIPAEYMQYYYYKNEVLAELQAKKTTRSQDIMAQVPDYWAHYREQAQLSEPTLDPSRSRGGIHELELAIDAMDAIFNDRGDILPINLPNQGALPEFPDDLVVEVRGVFDRHGVTRLQDGALPKHVVGLVKMLGEYQALAGDAAWHGNRKDAIRALASNPLVMSMEKATQLYDEMSAALKDYLPERLLS